MSKIFIFILLVAIIPQLQLFNSPVYADELPKCANPTANVIPDGHPTTPLVGTDRKATFKIAVGDNNAYSGWKIWFDCGGQSEKNAVNASIDIDGNSIFYELEKTNPEPCEFAEGSHKINVIGVNQYGQETAHCVTSYTVTSTLRYQESLCKLDITPQNDITTNTELTVSVSDLPANEPYHTSNKLYYKLYIDKDPVSLPFSQSYTGKIPPGYMGTNRTHVVYIKKSNKEGRNDGSILPVCQASYTVGTKDKPGSVLTPDAAPAAKVCTEQDIKDGKCTSGGGKTTPGCTDSKDNPGIATAVGCIHTNPAEFVKDLLRFVIGIGGGLAFLMMLLGAFQMLISAGNPDTLNAGRERLTSAVIGLLFVIFSVLLLQIIGVGILNIPGFKP